MNWLDWHRKSENCAAEASAQILKGNRSGAILSYREAAEWELQALALIPAAKERTRGIIAVSAAALWMKSEDFISAEKHCIKILSDCCLSDVFVEQIRAIVQSIWLSMAKLKSGITFYPGQVTVSIKGGEVITGGAPLDLVVEKVQTIQSIFYRTIEAAQGLPFRQKGGPSREVQEMCKPWLLQEPPGSYQFSIALQEPSQKDLLRESLDLSGIANQFLSIVSAAISDEKRLQEIVPDASYKQTFLKLSRNLAPTGNRFTQIDLQKSGEPVTVALTNESRNYTNKVIQKKIQKPRPSETGVSIRGILRAVHLDKDWLEILNDDGLVQVHDLADTVDDVIGPMVNRTVLVKALRTKKGSLKFVDIELEE